MKRNGIITLSVIGIIILIAAGIFLSYLFSTKNVRFSFTPQELSGVVYKSSHEAEDGSTPGDEKIAEVKNDQSIRLSPGSYYVTPTDTNYSDEEITFNVDKDMTVSVKPNLSKNRLSSLLTSEQPSITAYLNKQYPQLSNYTVSSGELFEDGTWYGAIATEKPLGPGDMGDIYRIVLHKVNGEWTSAATPTLILTSPENKDIPRSVIDAVNTIGQN